VQKDHIHRLTFSMAQTSTICVVKREKRKRKEKRKKEKEKEKGKERYGPLSRLASVNLFDYKIQVLPQQCIMSNKDYLAVITSSTMEWDAIVDRALWDWKG